MLKEISHDEIYDLAVSTGANPLVFLDSQHTDHPSANFSYLFADFDRWITFQNGEAYLHSSDGEKSKIAGTDPWKILSDFREQFKGYVCGYFGYDLKNYRDRLHSSNEDRVNLPEMWMGRAKSVYFAKVLPGKEPHQKNKNIQKRAYKITNLSSSVRREDYISQIKKAQKCIFEGDFYEINLSHQLSGEFEGNVLGLYDDMRSAGPVPFGSFMRIGETEICCASPERFLTRLGTSIVSDPIKGTRARGNSIMEDEQIARELTESAKDKAENLMIVDLVRNDFSIVCKPGSVNVEKLFEIQRFGTVHQMVSRIKGTLKDGISSEEVIAACFPMGSMTGAPKIKSMEIIELLENYKRGLYSGAIGFFKPDGDFNFNVVIRTAFINSGKIYYATGGAITADSDPQMEWEETIVKARALGKLPL